MSRRRLRADAVFQGGGVKVIGLVGALSVAEEQGYQWVSVAGTSAGAIVAALLAAGYRASEMKDLLDQLDFRTFRDPPRWARIPLVGPALAVALTKGLYLGDALEEWVRDALARRGVRTFADLIMPDDPDERFRFRLQVVAADVSRGRMVVLPQDIALYGVRPEELDVARAVRMSAGLPYFYRPVVQYFPTPRGGFPGYIVDGGLLSNFPVWLFDVAGPPPWPTLGFMLADPRYGKPHRIRGPVSFGSALVATMLEAHDARHLEASDSVRTIRIPTTGVRTTDFDLTPGQRRRLYEAGVEAARRFFAEWDFQRYVRLYRSGSGAGPGAGAVGDARSRSHMRNEVHRDVVQRRLHFRQR